MLPLMPEFWKKQTAAANTLPCDTEVMNNFSAPLERIRRISVPTRVMVGGKACASMTDAQAAVAAAIPGSEHRVLEGQTHQVSPTVIAAQLREFFVDDCGATVPHRRLRPSVHAKGLRSRAQRPQRPRQRRGRLDPDRQPEHPRCVDSPVRCRTSSRASGRDVPALGSAADRTLCRRTHWGRAIRRRPDEGIPRRHSSRPPHQPHPARVLAFCDRAFVGIATGSTRALIVLGFTAAVILARIWLAVVSGRFSKPERVSPDT